MEILTTLLFRAGKGMKVSVKHTHRKSDMDTTKPWRDEQCHNSRGRKFECLNKFRISNSVDDLKIYIDCRNQFQKMCKAKIKEYEMKQWPL